MASPRKPSKKAPAKAKPSDKPSSRKLKDVALRPAAEEFGNAYSPIGREVGETAVQVTRTLLRVVNATVRGANSVFDWLGETVEKHLQDVPPEKIVGPEPRILLPAANALAHSMDDELIREMFANLIAANMQSDKRASTHPAFVAMIKEMQPSDAKLLLELRRTPHIRFEMRYYKEHSKFREFGTATTVPADVVPEKDIALTLDNLARLRLADIRDNHFPVGPLYDEGRTKFRGDFANIQKQIDDGVLSDKDGNKPMLKIKEHGLYLPSLGSNFVSVCLPALSDRQDAAKN